MGSKLGAQRGPVSISDFFSDDEHIYFKRPCLRLKRRIHDNDDNNGNEQPMLSGNQAYSIDRTSSL